MATPPIPQSLTVHSHPAAEQINVPCDDIYPAAEQIHGTCDEVYPAAETDTCDEGSTHNTDDGGNHATVQLKLMHVFDLPEELIGKVFEFLTFFDSIKLSMTCHTFQRLVFNLARTSLSYIDLSSYDVRVTPALIKSALTEIQRHNGQVKFLDFSDRDEVQDEIIALLTDWAVLGTVCTVSHKPLSLTHLNLENCGSITESGLHTLLAMNMPEMKSLRLQNTQFQDETILLLVENHLNLTSLSLANNFDVSSAALRTVLTLCSHLRELEVVNFYWIENEAFAVAPLKLTTLKIELCHRLTDDLAVHLVRSGAPLKHLSVAGCLSLTYRFISLLTGQSTADPPTTLDLVERKTDLTTTLSSLDLATCYIMGDGALALLHNLPLHFLGLEACCNITGHAIEQLVDACPLLTDLVLRECSSIPRSSLTRLRDLGIRIIR